MATEHTMIPVADLCSIHHIDTAFIQSLQSYGLIHITMVQETLYIDSDQLGQLEQFIRLHYDLEINLAGIEAITHLLERVENMQEQIRRLQNRLHVYEINDLPGPENYRPVDL